MSVPTYVKTPPRRERRALEIIIAYHQAMDRALRDLTTEGYEMGIIKACVPGCAACCAYVVEVFHVECLRIVNVLQAMKPDERQPIIDRLFRWVDQWFVENHADPNAKETATVVRWQVKRIACPMLEPTSNRCTVYEARPMACRTHHATNPNPNAVSECGSCPVINAPQACVTTQAHVECGHAPSIWQFRNDLNMQFGGAIMDDFANSLMRDMVKPSVLPIGVLAIGVERHGWKARQVIELPIIG